MTQAVPVQLGVRGLSLRGPGLAPAEPAQNPLVQNLDCTLQAGQWLAVVGVNGVGKSTLLRALAASVTPQQGQVLLGDKPLLQYPARERARRLALLGQSVYPAQSARVYDLVMLGRLPWLDWWSNPSARDHDAVMHALTLCDLWTLRERDWQSLSGGEVQRVLIARAMATQAQVWLHDEPLANLDPQYQMAWVDAVRAHCAQGGVVVSVLHELHIALLADQILLLEQGGSLVLDAPDSPIMKAAIEAAFDHRLQIAPQGHISWR